MSGGRREEPIPQSALRTPPSPGTRGRGLGWLTGLLASAGLAWAQGTAFSYQGQLTDGTTSANGTYDLTFSLWNAATAGDQQGATLTQTAVGVTNGLFTATLDFGSQFNGQSRWLEIAVRTNGATAFTTLTERQPVLPTPYAIHAATAGSAATATTAGSATTATTATTVTGNVLTTQLTGTLSAAQIPDLDASKITTGTFTGNGSGLTSLNASALATGTVPVARVPNLDASKLTTGVLSPHRIPPLDASKISGGTFTGNGSGLNRIPLSALVQSDYSAVAWGDNGSGQTNVPAGLSDVIAVAAGYYYSLALRSDLTVVAWGNNGFGQTNVPAGLSRVAAVDAGRDHSLALRSDGTVVAWGYNGDGETNVPVGLSGVVAVAAGGFHSVALRSDGTVVAWGWNDDGQTNVPIGLSGVVAVAAGDFHSLALRSDGTVVAWGWNNYGQTDVPVDLSGVVAVAAGGYHSLTLKGDGKVVAWGRNDNGQRSVPADLSGVVAMAAGRFHNLVLVRETSSPASLARLDQGNVFQGGISALSFTGNGSGLTSLNASALTAGTVPAALIPDFDASKITSGTLTAPRIPLLDASKVSTGMFTAAQIPDLDASKITSGTFTGNGSGLTSLNASALTTGTVPVARIPNLDASKIVSGTFAGNGSGLTSLNASALTTGTVPVAQIPSLDASKVTTGILAAAQIPNLDASKIVSGTFAGNGSGLTSLNASALTTGTVPVAQIPSLDASKVTTGIFAAAQIPNLDGTKIATGIVSDARLSANVALENGSPAFSAAAGVRVASFIGSRTGTFSSAVVHVENTETGTSASPALRVLGRGSASDGALNVSAEAGRIARFGNSTDWVAVLDNDGKFSATSFISLSDRNKKAGFEPVDVEAVLAKVALLPLTTWHYTNDAAATPHLGPMAQDFHAAFGLGRDDKTIGTVDADGVAFAAIQGLHRKTEVLAAENAAIREELSAQRSANAEFRDELGEVRALVLQLQQQLNANRP